MLRFAVSRRIHLFKAASISTKDLQDFAQFLWGLGNQNITAEQKGRIREFLKQSLSWVNTLPKPPVEFLSRLSLLARYIDELLPEAAEWLLAVAPSVGSGYNADYFIEQLDRFADTYPAEVARILERTLEHHEPVFDFENRLQSILTKIADGGERLKVLVLADKLKNLPGMLELYARMKPI
ncbi:MAG: hypothetical protein JWQ10_3052 [Herbaspirillum sp.]|nr:hypothetical protein [Herbaspirillum sp.]